VLRFMLWFEALGWFGVDYIEENIWDLPLRPL
jgi:hypothetical protein